MVAGVAAPTVVVQLDVPVVPGVIVIVQVWPAANKLMQVVVWPVPLGNAGWLTCKLVAVVSPMLVIVMVLAVPD